MHTAHPDGPQDTTGPALRPLLGGARGAGPLRVARGIVLGTLAVTLAVTACGPSPDAPSASTTQTSVAPAPTTDPTAAPPAVAVPDVPVRSATELPAAAPPAPVSLTIDDLGIAMPVDPVGVEPDGSMSLPKSGQRAGWYEFGPAPAGQAGTVVVAAHVDTLTTGIGEFARLPDIQTGAQIQLVDSAGATFTYTVSTTERIDKASVPLDQVFDRAGDRRLVLVTCGGTFDRSTGHYVDNVIVTALPVT